MRIVEAFSRIKEGKALGARRTSWKSDRAVYVITGHLYLSVPLVHDEAEAFAYHPHSIDIRANDWVMVHSLVD